MGCFMANLCGMFCQGCQKRMDCVLSRYVLSYIYTMDFPKSIVSYQKEENITTQRVNAIPVPIPDLT